MAHGFGGDEERFFRQMVDRAAFVSPSPGPFLGTSPGTSQLGLDPVEPGELPKEPTGHFRTILKGA